ncbi:alpha-galactosidase, partial [Parabacteroides sp. OttesenSCG-928-O15]|nr:alpha-galactosidase [Parabacteroides sp. OttesenSCG-928-O15]
MKKMILTCCIATLLCLSLFAQSTKRTQITIATNDVHLVYQVADNGRLYQTYLGKPLRNTTEYALLPMGQEAYITHGMEDYFEPAIRVLHNDGNPSLLLKYVSHTQQLRKPGITETVITLSDDKYPVIVKLFFIAFAEENIIKEYTEISHQEKKPVTLYNYASSMLHLKSDRYFLTEFAGDWAHEANMTERQLDYGKKTVDTKLGSRA